MPGFMTHLLFGEQAIPFIDDKSLRSMLNSHLNVYSLGLQGPDLFFYHIPAYLFYKHNIGNVIHEKETNLFLNNLIDSRNLFEENFDREIADSYILGFLGHYCLDTVCHPYIYSKSNHFDNLKKSGKFDFGKHVSLETDIDHLLLLHYKKLLPNQFDYAKAISLSSYENHIVTEVLYSAIYKTFPEYKVTRRTITGAIKSITSLNHAMHDPKGTKKARVRNIEHMLFHCDFISSMIPSDTIIKYTDPCNENNSNWSNPWNSDSLKNQSIYDLISQSMEHYLELISLYNKYISSDLDENIVDDTKAYCLLRKELSFGIGNLSYITGLPI